MRAQQQLPEAQKLYTIGFRIELENKCKLDELDVVQRAEALYASSRVQKFTNAEFYIEMLEIIDKFSYAHAIQQHILDDMQDMCPHAEIRWHTLAQRELKGLSSKINCAVDFSGLIKMECDDAENNKNTGFEVKFENTNAKRIESCIKTYEDAVKDVTIIFFSTLSANKKKN